MPLRDLPNDRKARHASLDLPADPPAAGETLSKEMRAAAEDLDFERAAKLRDRIKALAERDLRLRDPGAPRRAVSRTSKAAARRSRALPRR